VFASILDTQGASVYFGSVAVDTPHAVVHVAALTGRRALTAASAVLDMLLRAGVKADHGRG
jgi:hypothetical protein